MRLLTVVAEGGRERQAAVSEALREWNRGLDIRLRFLNIGVEESVLEPEAPGDPGAGLEEVERALLREHPAMLLLHGGGPVALGAAVSAAKAAVPIVRTGAGRRGGAGAGEERAADRLAALRLADGAPEFEALRGEGLAGVSEEVGPPGDPASAGRVIKAVIRILRDL